MVFDIHMSVHRNIIPNYSQQDATFLEFISTDALHISGSSSTHHRGHNCTYSFRYCQPILLLAATMDKMELIHGSSWQQYWLTMSCFFTMHCIV